MRHTPVVELTAKLQEENGHLRSRLEYMEKDLEEAGSIRRSAYREIETLRAERIQLAAQLDEARKDALAERNLAIKYKAERDCERAVREATQEERDKYKKTSTALAVDLEAVRSWSEQTKKANDLLLELVEKLRARLAESDGALQRVVDNAGSEEAESIPYMIISAHLIEEIGDLLDTREERK